MCGRPALVRKAAPRSRNGDLHLCAQVREALEVHRVHRFVKAYGDVLRRAAGKLTHARHPAGERLLEVAPRHQVAHLQRHLGLVRQARRGDIPVAVAQFGGHAFARFGMGNRRAACAKFDAQLSGPGLRLVPVRDGGLDRICPSVRAVTLQRGSPCRGTAAEDMFPQEVAARAGDLHFQAKALRAASVPEPARLLRQPGRSDNPTAPEKKDDACVILCHGVL